ncbi:MAG TPA: transglycosylase SLT domain-containing protein [Thermoleophilaceae bacterium]|nr:transglycosylase SLT domain-containing protein [Thermoleophilaceae bacterium]
MTGRRTRRLQGLIVAAVLIAAAVGLILALTGGGKGKLKPAAGNGGGTYDPLAYDKDRRAEFEQDAATGEGHVVFAKSPGGVIATARRTAHFRPLIDRAAKAGGIDPNMLEAVVFLESAGRPDVVAGNDLSGATGLTQILAETGTNLLGMHVNLAASKRLTRRIDNARSAKGRQRLERSRMRVDQRFDPARSLAATVRYLTIARKQFGQDDFAFTSYHMGIGNLQSVLRDYGGGKDLTYAQVYFDSSPLNHPKAYALLSRFGDDSSNYYWKLLEAKRIMSLYRSNPASLRSLSALQNGRASAELVLHPEGTTQVFANPQAVLDATAADRLARLPNDPKKYGFQVDPLLGQFASRLGQKPAAYSALRPEALALLVYLSEGVRAIATGSSPLLVTSAVRDEKYQRLVAAANIEATHGYSLHTTGYAFDIRRRYSSRAQALAFQFMLDRLQAMNLIAWVREPDAIHVTVSSSARRLEPLLH